MSHTKYAHNGAVRLAYEDLGGDGEPLLLVMGLGVSRFWWPEGFVARLRDAGFHVVAFDQRDAGESTRFRDVMDGHPAAGLSKRATAAYSAEDMTDDAIAVMDAMGWASAHLFGHSMGGLLTQRLALRHPGRVRSITSSSAVPSDANGLLSMLRYIRLSTMIRLSRIKFPPGREGDIAAGMALARLMASADYPLDEAAARRRVERDSTSGVRDTAAQQRQLSAHWRGPRLAMIDAPALVLHGQSDPLLRPAAARHIAAAIPGARLRTFPGVGHDIPEPVWPEYVVEIRAIAAA